MAIQKSLKNNLIAGQVSEELAYRDDIDALNNGALVAKNQVPSIYGGMKTRPGTKLLLSLNGSVIYNTKESRIFEFRFDSDEIYLVWATELTLNIYTYDTVAQTLSFVQQFSGGSGWTATVSNLRGMAWTQAADVAIMVFDGVRQPLKLTRTSLSTFTLEQFAFDTDEDGFLNQPYFQFINDLTDFRLEPVGGAGVITTYSEHFTQAPGATVQLREPSGGVFSASWVNETVRVQPVGYESPIDITITQYLAPDRLRGTASDNIPRSYAVYLTDRESLLPGDELIGKTGDVRVRVHDAERSNTTVVQLISGRFKEAADWEDLVNLRNGAEVRMRSVKLTLGSASPVFSGGVNPVIGETFTGGTSGQTFIYDGHDNFYDQTSGLWHYAVFGNTFVGPTPAGTETYTGGTSGATFTNSGLIIPAINFSASQTLNLSSLEEQVWSLRRGYPTAVTLHGGRLWLGGGVDAPNFLAGSRAGLFFDFGLNEGLDDGSIQGFIGSDEVSELKHLVSSDRLEIYTDRGPFYMASGVGDEPVTPSNANPIRQTRLGCNDMQPVIVDEGTVFCTTNGVSIREFIWDESIDKYTANSLSLLTDGIVANPLAAATRDPVGKGTERLTFFINEDGTGFILTTVRSQNIIAFTPVIPKGPLFIDTARVGDQIFVLMQNVFGSDRPLGIGVLDDRYALDMWTEYSGVAVDNLVLSEDFYTFQQKFMAVIFNGDTVDVDLNEYDVGEFLVSTNTLNFSSTGMTSAYFAYGYGFDQEIELPPPMFEVGRGTERSEYDSIVSVRLQLKNTVSIEVNGEKRETPTVTFDPSEPRARLVDWQEFYPLGWGFDQTVRIVKPDHLPLHILAVVTEVEV